MSLARIEQLAVLNQTAAEMHGVLDAIVNPEAIANAELRVAEAAEAIGDLLDHPRLSPPELFSSVWQRFELAVDVDPEPGKPRLVKMNGWKADPAETNAARFGAADTEGSLEPELLAVAVADIAVPTLKGHKTRLSGNFPIRNVYLGVAVYGDALSVKKPHFFAQAPELRPTGSPAEFDLKRYLDKNPRNSNELTIAEKTQYWLWAVERLIESTETVEIEIGEDIDSPATKQSEILAKNRIAGLLLEAVGDQNDEPGAKDGPKKRLFSRR